MCVHAHTLLSCICEYVVECDINLWKMKQTKDKNVLEGDQLISGGKNISAEFVQEFRIVDLSIS